LPVAGSILRPGVFFSAMFLFVADAFGGEASPVRAMIEESGTAEQFGLIAQMYPLRVRNAALVDGLPSESAAALADIAAQAMDAARMVGELESALSGAFSSDDIAVMREFSGSPVGVKVRRVEGQSLTVRHRAEVESRQFELLLGLNDTPFRRDLLREVDENRLISELSAAVTASLIHTVTIGVLAVQDSGTSEEELVALAAGTGALQQALLPSTRDDTGAILFDAYSRLSNRELEIYAAFLGTDEARAAHRKILAATRIILEARHPEIVRAFLDYLRRSRN